MKCDNAFINYTQSELEQMAATADQTVVSKQQFGVHPGIGIPKGLRVTCPNCGRPNVLVKPFCLGGSRGHGRDSWTYGLYVHKAEKR